MALDANSRLGGGAATAQVSKAGGMTPAQSIKAKCYDCAGFNKAQVEGCPFPNCTLYPFRFGRKPSASRRRGKDVGESEGLSTMVAIRQECMSCMGGGRPLLDIAACPESCPLWPPRFGRKLTNADVRRRTIAARARLEAAESISREGSRTLECRNQGCRASDAPLEVPPDSQGCLGMET